MKKRYTKAEMEIIEFDTEDVIQTSKKAPALTIQKMMTAMETSAADSFLS